MMDVLSGRKTGGIIEGAIRVGGTLKCKQLMPEFCIIEFVAEVLQIMELDDMKEALLGIPTVGGISIEQRKRLTIAVKLVSNPSIIFMDEPASGLDARAATIVTRVV
ncbi:hypothetical protein CRG98_037684 [Punica granatum]|uniref:ABC transporter domain-containing protein n=1 Tax=Punica granatum TaxID=22663 RepID=A0A2I0ID64_PUNGR|nr:hypothetical protein CRG98_037684 [Punica granatum]